MTCTPLIIDCLVNNSFYTKSMIDTGCLCFSVFCDSLVRKNNLITVEIPKRPLRLANGKVGATISSMACAIIDIDGRQEKVWGYVMPNLAYPLILGKPWMEKNNVVYLAKRHCLRIGGRKKGIIVRSSGWYENGSPTKVQSQVSHVTFRNTALISAESFAKIVKQPEANAHVVIGAISMKDIEQALKKKDIMQREEVMAGLPKQIQKYTELFWTIMREKMIHFHHIDQEWIPKSLCKKMITVLVKKCRGDLYMGCPVKSF